MENGPSHIVLKIKDTEFSCDRKLLAFHSDYFRAMFDSGSFIESQQECVTLKDVDPEAFGFINEALNESDVDFTRFQNVLDILETTSMLQFDELQNKCITYINSSWLNKETWLPTAIVADKLGLVELKRKTKTLALWNFSEVRKTELFLQISPKDVIEYLNDDTLRTTEGEFEVFEAGVNWIEFSPEDRLFYSIPLLQTVRLKEMDTFDIRNMLHFTSVKDTPQAELIIECVLEMIEGILNHSCEACNSPLPNDLDNSVESGKSSPSPTEVFFRNFKRKRRITTHCSCFDSATVKSAQEMLSRNVRCLPLVPCVVASLTKEKIVTPQSARTGEKTWPHIFHWNGTQLVPFIHLSKIDEGPVEAIGFKVVIKDSKLYIIGGEHMMGFGEWNTSIWFYDIWNETWHFETSLPSPRRHHSALCINNDLYIIGGVGRHRVMLDSVIKYNLITKSWENCAPLPISMYSTPCCAYQEDIFIFGPQLYCFRQAVSNWELISNFALPEKTAVAAAMTDGNIIYIIGINRKLYSFVPQPKRIEVQELGQFRIASNNACLVNKSIFSIGEDDEIQSVEEYDIRKKTFNTLYYKESEDKSYTLFQAAGCFPLPKYF